MSEIRWTDKVYLDSQGDIRSMNGCPTDLMTQALIDRITTNVGLSQPLKLLIRTQQQKVVSRSCLGIERGF